MSNLTQHQITHRDVGKKIWKYLKNNPLALEQRNIKISNAHLGKKKPWAGKYDHTGIVPWNKGLKGIQVPWNKGKTGVQKMSDATRLKISLSKKGTTNAGSFKSGHIPWHKGKVGVYSQATISKIRASRVKQVFPRSNTKIEIMIQRLLQDNKIFFKSQEPLENICVADFYIPKNKKVVFCDGDYWHNLPDYIARDEKQNQTLKSKGYQVIRLWEHEIKNDLGNCLQRILI